MFEEKRFIIACKQINRKIPDPCIAKEHYQSLNDIKVWVFFRKKNNNTESVKQSKNIKITKRENAFKGFASTTT